MTRKTGSGQGLGARANRAASSVKSRFYLVIAAVVIVLIGMFSIGRVGLDILSAVRAYVAGEGLWSKGQAEAAYELERYLVSQDATDYESYLRNLAIPLSLERARLELESPDPDTDELRRAFLDAGIHRDDVDGMVWLFRRFGWLDPIQAAVDTWARADVRVAELQVLGSEIHDRVQAGTPTPEELRSLGEEVNVLHSELTGLATEFSERLGEAARWARGLLILVLVGFTVIGAAVCVIGLVLVTRIGATLQESNVRLAEQHRQQAGQNAIHELTQGERELDRLLPGILGFLTDFVGAQIGAIYVARAEGTLRLFGSHGVGDGEELPREIPAGQGLVGQVARDGTSRLLTDVPHDFVKVRTTLGSTPPNHVFVLPLRYEDRTKAVLELGAIHPFSPDNLAFLESVAQSMAITIATLQARNRVDALLAESQQLTEELEAQQEELRQTNDELEAQAAALEQSQTELEETNVALEEKSEELEAQQAEIEQKNADLEATKLLLEEKARKLETTSRYKSEFLANMSHELRTPLNSIILLSNLLTQNRDSNLTEKQVEFARTIMSSGSDLLHLINEVLDLSKVEAGRMELNLEEIDLAAFLSVLERGFRQTATQQDLSFVVEVAEDVPSRIETDERRLGQILKNLLSNAIKFTETGSVELKVAPPDPSEAVYGGKPLPEGPLVAFSVVDTGIGIPEEERERIFGAFRQVEGSTDRKYGGTGLGLSISKELAELLGGRIYVDSAVGEGSRFTVVVPATPPDRMSRAASGAGAMEAGPAERRSRPEEWTATGSEAAAETSAGDAVEPAVRLPPSHVEDDRKEIQPGDRCLLIVEDDVGFARVLLDLARERGFLGLVAEDGRTALQLADYYKPSAVLLDIGLPDIDGMSIMERLKANLATRHIPVHVISAGQRKYEALKKGAVGFLSKPVNVSQLDGAFKRIEELLSRPVRRLLVAVADESERNEIVDVIGAQDVEITAVATAGETVSLLSSSSFDCVLLEDDLPDMGGADLMKRIRGSSESHGIPVVAIVSEDPADDERVTIDRYADGIVVKDGRYSERLLDETALFLHRIEKDLPEDKRRMLHVLHDSEAILRDKTILIVDDDMRNIFALSSILEERGMRTVPAKTGREALDRLETHPEIDLVLMDLMMPEMDGFEAMRRIRADPAFRKVPVIALTAKAMRGDRAKCIEAGANDYLAKPVDTDRLLSVLRVWLYR